MAERPPYLLSLDAIPEFGSGVRHRAAPCTARELFCALFVDLEESAHFSEPAFDFLAGALDETELPDDLRWEVSDGGAGLLEWARSAASAPDPELDASSALAVVREFAPLGLADGAWLRGFALANSVESPVGMHMLKQLMTRFGDPASREPYAARYAALLRSLGIRPESVTRLTADDTACSDLAYEHALLGVSLGLFPTSFGPETLGYNLWMAAIGPCPLLHTAVAVLRERAACQRYIELHDTAELGALAERAIREAAREANADSHLRQRIARGFVLAQRAYERWLAGVTSARSARAAASTGNRAGNFGPPQDPMALLAHAVDRYGSSSKEELFFACANADLFPSIVPFGRVLVERVFGHITDALATDDRLNSRCPPPYSERYVAEMVARQHDRNVNSRAATRVRLGTEPQPELGKQSITQIFDGSWLQGFADVRHAHVEEYGWLFRIYASEHGDGDFAWNHCQIFRRAFAELGPDVMLPKTDRRLYSLFDIGMAAVATIAVSLNTRHFMPEILGINLGIEATGVAGAYMDDWKTAEERGSVWRALAWRLHNSIDNYADGHTKWAVAAVQSYMRRVKDGTPSEVERQWQRIWRPWRCQEILTHGSDSERSALGEYLDVKTLAPTG